MKIVNVDAKQELVFKIINLNIQKFVYDTIRPVAEILYSDRMYNSIDSIHRRHRPQVNTYPIRTFVYDRYENVSDLLHTIPIYLREYRPDNIENTDKLGAYYSFTNSKKSPYIELYLHEINEVIKNDTNADEHFKWLFTMVLIHELAHAALDVYNYEPYIDKSIYGAKTISYKTEYYRWREESMANAVALHIVRKSRDKHFFAYVKLFMMTQPAEYALGVKFERDVVNSFMSVVSGKVHGVNKHLQQVWLDYVKGTPTESELQAWDNRLSCQRIYLYKGKYYTEEKELVEKIVDDVLNRYQTKNHCVMTCDEFQKIFPRFQPCGNMNWTYEPAELVQDNKMYNQERIILRDGEFSLCISWHHTWNNDQLRIFTKKSGCHFKEYKNYQ